MGVQGAWQYDANQAYMRMPLGGGVARIDFRPSHAFEVVATLTVALP